MAGDPLRAPGNALRVPLHFDFASSLCFVAHRVMDDLAPDVEALGLVLDWRPIDLVTLRGLERGAPLRPSDRDRIDVVARDLDVRLRPPPAWIDSRSALAAAAVVSGDDAARGAALRERLFSAIFEEGRPPEDAEACGPLLRDLGLSLEPEAWERGKRAVEAHTADARARQVTGVPSFQLGRWPFGGIQHRDTMRRVLERFARKARAGALGDLEP